MSTALHRSRFDPARDGIRRSLYLERRRSLPASLWTRTTRSKAGPWILQLRWNRDVKRSDNLAHVLTGYLHSVTPRCMSFNLSGSPTHRTAAASEASGAASAGWAFLVPMGPIQRPSAGSQAFDICRFGKEWQIRWSSLISLVSYGMDKIHDVGRGLEMAFPSGQQLGRLTNSGRATGHPH